MSIALFSIVLRIASLFLRGGYWLLTEAMERGPQQRFAP
jgi:hypothetical protein